MADDIQSYILQLQQVEAALLSDSDNKELLKLKEDLEEVIELSKDLKAQVIENTKNDSIIPGSSAALYLDRDDEIRKALLAAQRQGTRAALRPPAPVIPWKEGDKCLAKWSNGQYYDAVIDRLLPDGKVNVTFDTYKNRAVLSIVDLKDIAEKKIEPERSRRYPKVNQREYLKKKKQKKQQRFKELEAEKEVEKNKWLAFSSKAAKKGLKNKSIFASPDNVNGRVGIGTCGVSGLPMTEYIAAEKRKKDKKV